MLDVEFLPFKRLNLICIAVELQYCCCYGLFCLKMQSRLDEMKYQYVTIQII